VRIWHRGVPQPDTRGTRARTRRGLHVVQRE